MQGQCGQDTWAKAEGRVASPRALLLPALLPRGLLPTSLEQARPPLQAAVPALQAELELALEQAQVGSIPQGVSEAGLPPTELLLPTGQLQQVTLLQVGPTLCWGCHGAQPWEGRQDFSPGQAREGERRYSCDPWGLRWAWGVCDR